MTLSCPHVHSNLHKPLLLGLLVRPHVCHDKKTLKNNFFERKKKKFFNETVLGFFDS